MASANYKNNAVEHETPRRRQVGVRLMNNKEHGWATFLGGRPLTIAPMYAHIEDPATLHNGRPLIESLLDGADSTIDVMLMALCMQGQMEWFVHRSLMGAKKRVLVIEGDYPKQIQDLDLPAEATEALMCTLTGLFMDGEHMEGRIGPGIFDDEIVKVVTGLRIDDKEYELVERIYADDLRLGTMLVA